MIPKRVHEFFDSKFAVITKEGARSIHTCARCGRGTSIGEKRLAQLPPQMAECKNGRQLSVFEKMGGLVFQTYNCVMERRSFSVWV